MANKTKEEIIQECKDTYKLYNLKFNDRVNFLQKLFDMDLIEDEYVAEVLKAEAKLSRQIDIIKRLMIYLGRCNNLDLESEAESFSFHERAKVGLL